MFTIIGILLYIVLYLIYKKPDPIIEKFILAFVILDAYIVSMLFIYKEVHELYGPMGPRVTRIIEDPINGNITINEYPLQQSGTYHTVILDASAIQQLIVKNLIN